MPARFEVVDVDGQEVRITNPDKVFWPQSGTTKLDLVNYYIAVGEGALRGCRSLDEKGGLGDAARPPHFPKADNEPPRVQPSRRRHRE